MCFTMSLVKERQELEEEFSALFEELSLTAAYGVSGFSHPLWPIIPSEDPRTVRRANWGLIPFWVKTREEAAKIRNMTLNARLETAWKLPSFRSSVGPRRCLAVVDGFFEPHRYGGKSYPFFIYRRDRRPFALGGLYDRWKDPATGRQHASFSVLTVPARGLLERIHNEKLRMPAVIPGGQYQQWLDARLEKDHVESIAASASMDEFTAHPVGPMIYSRKQEGDPSLLQKQWKYGIFSVDELIPS